MIDEDVESWFKYPQYRNWFNKLFVADFFGYKCGPASVPIPEDGYYITRPTYNLKGMGAGAKICYYNKDDIPHLPAGHFWCEVFTGGHYSVDYVKRGEILEQLVCFQGYNNCNDLSYFLKWERIDKQFALPTVLFNLDVERLNIEIIGDKVIEVHLRGGFDHMLDYTELYPVFENTTNVLVPDDCTWIEGEEDGNGEITNKRLGYYVK